MPVATALKNTEDEQGNPSPASATYGAENRVQIVAARKPSFEPDFLSSLSSVARK
jgi:hypothetical protein